MNEEKFTGKSDIYTQARPAYPSEFIEYLYGAVGFKADSTIADFGSGTGILTKILLARGSTVYGIEPNKDMRESAEEQLKGFQKFTSVDSPAESTSLDDNSIDFITVAQAFHWFDKGQFQKECTRILRPTGKVCLVWNVRNKQDEMVKECQTVIRKYCPEDIVDGIVENEHFLDFFKGELCERRVFEQLQPCDKATFLGVHLSRSYAPKEGEANYDAFVQGFSRIFEKHSNSEGILEIPYTTHSFVGEVALDKKI